VGILLSRAGMQRHASFGENKFFNINRFYLVLYR
jgi:hypothetical protein